MPGRRPRTARTILRVGAFAAFAASATTSAAARANDAEIWLARRRESHARDRTQEEIGKVAARLRADDFSGEVRILTSCPACLQGLSRFDDDAGTRADYIVVEMAKHLLGENWASRYVDRANHGGIERVLL